MDNTLIGAHPTTMAGFRFDLSVIPNQNLVEFNGQSSSNTSSCESSTSSSSIFESDSPDGNDFCNVVLKYISDMLMEEDLESENFVPEDCLALEAAEKSFYDVLDQKYPPPSLRFDPNTVESSGSGWMFSQAEFEFGCSSEKKHHQLERSGYSDERSSKQSAVSVEKHEDGAIFDEILLGQAENNGSKSCAGGGKVRKKRGGSKKTEMMDLWTVLPQCAQAVADDDQVTAKDLLRQIRQYSSPFGDGNQRIAHYFANGLEARLAGSGTPGYTPAISSTTSAASVLKAHHIFITACPFQTMSHLYANETIIKLSENVTRLHIIDFGILYGFQWPNLIQRLSTRIGGPPKLCITGIEFPQPGFRPAERVEETGRRLRKYCERFNVPFEYYHIAQNWASIQYDDFNINENEMVVVNSLYRFKNLPDDTMIAKSVRDAILQLVRKINPCIFIHGVVNGTYNAPFFRTRFRDTLFHFSALFDMFDSTIPREERERMTMEEVFGRYAVNVIACEGGERVERPETYRQWQVRNLRAGFRQLPLDEVIMKKVRSTVKSNYNKNFMVDEDSQWMLQGWKGRIIYALSVWKPVHD